MAAGAFAYLPQNIQVVARCPNDLLNDQSYVTYQSNRRFTGLVRNQWLVRDWNNNKRFGKDKGTSKGRAKEEN